jgi:hypothetical protein
MRSFSGFSLLLSLFALISGGSAFAKEASVKANALNLRTQPGGRVVCTLPRNASLQVSSVSSDGWAKVKVKIPGCEAEGYVSSGYLDYDSASGGHEEKAENIALVATEKYNPKKEQGRGFSEFTSSLGLFAFGNIYRLTALDVEKQVLEKLNTPELKTYFPSQKERERFASAIADSVNHDFLSRGMTNDNVIAATQFAAESILGEVVDRAMKKEGVKSPGRRALWKGKILAPFRVCMKRARTYVEGNKCLDAAQEDAVKNIGLAIGYEMIRQETGPEYTGGAADAYKRCLRLNKDGANDRVTGCVLQVMREAVASFGSDKVRGVALEQAPEKAEALAASAKRSFAKCLKKADDRDGFSRCADDLSIEAGGQIASAALLSNEYVKTYFPGAKDREKLAEAGKDAFLDCMEKNRKNGKRDNSGALSTDNCSTLVRMNTAHSVARALINSNLDKISGLTSEQKVHVSRDMGAELDRCWDSAAGEKKNNACMKSMIEDLVGSVADIKLAGEISPALAAENPDLKGRLTDSVKACVKKELPEDVMNSPDAAKKVDGCAARLLKEGALAVADFELRQAIHGKTKDPDAADQLVNSLVKKDFSGCLGEAPTESILGSCTVKLKKSAASSVGSLVFKEELGRFLKKDPAGYGISEKEKSSYLTSLLAKHQVCLNGISNPDTADAAVDSCFKQSINEMAGFLAHLAFTQSSREYIQDARSLASEANRFRADFSSCLNEKASAEYSLNDYIAHIDSCTSRLTDDYTLKLGSMQLKAALAENLSGKELSGKRRELYKDLHARFTLCLNRRNGVSDEERDLCVSDMKKQATYAIALEAARDQGKALLAGGPWPKGMAVAEAALKKCVEIEPNPEACARIHAQNTAKIIGGLKLKVSLGSALGEGKYKDSGRKIASLEQDFFACIDSIPGTKPDAAFMQALRDCGSKLEAAGKGLVGASLDQWLKSPEATPQEAKLREEIAEVLPCMDGLLPPSPVEEAALSHLQPEGMLEAVSKVVGDYINYDAGKADGDFDEILDKVLADMEAAGSVESRRKLFDLLIKRGMVDQLLKSMIRSEVKKSIDKLPPEDQLSPELQAVLLDKKTLEAALTPELMEKFRPFMAEKLLTPLLIEGKSLSDPAQKASLKELEKQVAEALLDSPAFGAKLVSGTVQKQIDEETKGTLSRWFARNLMGYSYDWEEIRSTEGAKQAETYILNQIVRPLILGQNVAQDEMKRRREEAGRLVTQAVKNQ